MPPDTTKQQFCLMLQNLLSQRFKMAIHRETKGFPGYALVVAKNGPKLKESVNIPPPQSNIDPQPLTSQQMLTALRSQPRDAYGFPKSSPDPKLAGGRAGVSSIMNERGLVPVRPTADNARLGEPTAKLGELERAGGGRDRVIVKIRLCFHVLAGGDTGIA